MIALPVAVDGSMSVRSSPSARTQPFASVHSSRTCKVSYASASPSCASCVRAILGQPAPALVLDDVLAQLARRSPSSEIPSIPRVITRPKRQG